MDPGACTEPELTEPVDLCRRDGTLNPDAIGWTRSPLHRGNLPHGMRAWGRAKRWDYWCVTAEPTIVSLTVAQVDYLALVSVWFRDLDSGRHVSRDLALPLGGGVSLPERVGGFDIVVERFGSTVALQEEPGGTRLRFDTTVKGGERFDADLLVSSPEGHETLGVVIPWSQRLFQYTSKHNTRPATGTVHVGCDEYAFGGDGADAWGCLDYGRGRWPYRTAWNWGSASGRTDGHTVGLQLGGKWTAGTGMTENAVCVDGCLHKISEELVWEYGLDDPLRPWAITTPVSDRIDLAFEPSWNRSSKLDVGVASTRTSQVFGRYHGSIVTDAGDRVAVDSLFGWAEDCRWKW